MIKQTKDLQTKPAWWAVRADMEVVSMLQISPLTPSELVTPLCSEAGWRLRKRTKARGKYPREDSFQLTTGCLSQTLWKWTAMTWCGSPSLTLSNPSLGNHLSTSEASISCKTSSCSRRLSNSDLSACATWEYRRLCWRRELKLDSLWLRLARSCADPTRMMSSHLYSSRLYARQGCVPTWWLRFRQESKTPQCDWFCHRM